MVPYEVFSDKMRGPGISRDPPLHRTLRLFPVDRPVLLFKFTNTLLYEIQHLLISASPLVCGDIVQFPVSFGIDPKPQMLVLLHLLASFFINITRF